MSCPTRAAKCMPKRVCRYYSETPALSWSLPCLEMPSEIGAVTDANWAGELEGLRSISCGWIYFGDHLLETYSSTQQIVTLSIAESECISITKGAAHALEVRSAMVKYGMTFNVVCETDASAGRAMAMRHGVGRVRHFGRAIVVATAVVRRRCARSSSQAWRAQRGRPGNKDGRFETNDLAVERNVPLIANGLELMDGGGDSPRGCKCIKRLPCTNLNVRTCARRAAVSGSVGEWSLWSWRYCRTDRLRIPLVGWLKSTEGDRRECCVTTSNGKWAQASWESVQIRTLHGTSLRMMWNCGYDICKNRLDGSAVYPICVKARPSIVRRQSEMWW